MRWLLPVSLLALYGCGGSSDDNVPVVPISLSINGVTEVTLGDSVDFTVAASSGSSITSVKWQVTGGSGLSNTTTPLAAHTQAIGFDPATPGDYQISVFATYSNGEVHDDTTTLTVLDGGPKEAVLRIGHETSEGGNVSLRVDNNSLKGITSINWRQVSGTTVPSFTYDEGSYSHHIYFQAPRVNVDEVIEIEATLAFDDGSTDSDIVQVLVKNIDIDRNAYFVDDSGTIPQTVSSHMQPYHADSPYADALSDCVYNNTLSESCRFSTLPLIGQQTESPTIDDILDRTYVSHPWMGDAFKDFLETSDTASDLLSMLRATTAVVIAYDIRPSFYWAVTGAIYLDANNFWRSPEERDTLNTQPDYRSNFGNDLDFSIYWRYTRNNEYFYPQPGLAASDRRTRTREGVEAALSWLMYHELAHANDFFDYTTWSSLSNSDTPLNFFNENSQLSTGLSNALPLSSSQLHALAQVSYGGNTASSTQRNYSAQQVADWFEGDGAITYYSYYTDREDFANLVERFMMLYRINVSSDVGILSKDAINNGTYSVTWGQRNRVNDDQVRLRAEYAVSRIMPALNVSEIQATLPSAMLFPENSTWFNSVDLSSIEQHESFTTQEKIELIEQHRRMETTIFN